MKRGLLQSLVQGGIHFLIRLYQGSVSPFLGPCCRFFPSCSAYSSLSIQRFGVVKGSWASLKRLCKCHPFHPGGYDPVPEETEKNLEGDPAREIWIKKVS